MILKKTTLPNVVKDMRSNVLLNNDPTINERVKKQREKFKEQKVFFDMIKKHESTIHMILERLEKLEAK